MARWHLERQAGPEADERRHPGRVTTRVLQILLVLYLLGAFTTLISAVIRTGDYAALFAPGLDRLGDPKDSIPSLGPEAWWNPLDWFVAVPFAVAVFLFLVLPPAALWVAALSLIRARGRSLRAAAWIAVWAAVTAMAYSDYGADLHRWLLD